MRQYISYSDFKKVFDSVRREVLYNILAVFGVPMKLVRLIKMCLNETYSKVCIFISKMVLKKEMLYHHCFSPFLCHSKV
jgi:hypothetical protein